MPLSINSCSQRHNRHYLCGQRSGWRGNLASNCLTQIHLQFTLCINMPLSSNNASFMKSSRPEHANVDSTFGRRCAAPPQPHLWLQNRIASYSWLRAPPLGRNLFQRERYTLQTPVSTRPHFGILWEHHRGCGSSWSDFSVRLETGWQRASEREKETYVKQQKLLTLAFPQDTVFILEVRLQ